MKNILYQAYHVAVDDTLIQDFGSLGCTIYMPANDFNGQIAFYRSNQEFIKYPFVKLVNFEELSLLDFAVLIPCAQLLDDLLKIREKTKPECPIILLSALSNSLSSYALHLTDYVISHDIYYHRATQAKYKILYFSPPEMLISAEKDIIKCFDEKQIKLYINNFPFEGFEPEYLQAKAFRELWIKKTNKFIPFFGYGNENGSLDKKNVQMQMLDSMFTLVFKRRETWGQMVNESMLLGTPCIFLRQFMHSTFRFYEITEDNSIIGDDIFEIVERISRMTIEQYETLGFEAKKTALMFADSNSRRYQLNWLMNKVN